MTPRTSTIAAALGLAAFFAVPAAQAADRVQYRAELKIDGAWGESVRAGADEADTDGDGREEVAARDQELRFTVHSAVPGIAFRGGRPAPRTTSVQHSFPSLTVARSTLTEPNGEPGSCRAHEPGTGGAAEVVATRGRFAFRPAEDVIFQMVCSTEHLEWGFAMDAMRAGGAIGQAPLDASFGLAASEVGAQRIVRSVAASPAQRSLERCPREDPGHTVACRFEWTGSVVLERTDSERAIVRRARLATGARSVSAEMVCRAACSPVLSLAGSKRRLHAAAGTSRVVLPLGRDSRRTVLRTGRGGLKVRLDGRTRSFVLRARRVAASAASAAGPLRLENGTLVLTATPGVDNGPSFSQPRPGTLRISDAEERFENPGHCTVLDPDSPSDVDCPMPTKLRVELGDGNDRVQLRESLPPIPVEVLGQAGADVLSANNDVDNRVVLDGGEGADTLTGYAFADTLLGGSGDDLLRGGAGGDVLRAGDGDDALEPDGAPDVQGDDIVDGGAGFDSVKDWGSTSTDPAFAVAVTVDAIADDGRPGERDNVTGIERFDALSPGRYVLTDAADSIDLPNFGTSAVEGRGGDDGITGNDGAETIDGGGGADRLEGGFGHDTLTGGPGRDTIFGDETAQRCSYGSDCAVVAFGNDTILARDGEADTIDCGVGTDRAVVDPDDIVANCETVEQAEGPKADEPAGGQSPRRTIGLAQRVGLRKALRRGLPVKLIGLPVGRRQVIARHRGRIVGRATVRIPVSGRATTRLRFTPAARRTLSRRRSAKLVLTTPGARLAITLR